MVGLAAAILSSQAQHNATKNMTDFTYNASQLQGFCRYIVNHGNRVDSRQNGTTEMIMSSFDVRPAVLSACRIRKFNIGFAIAEFASLVTGHDNLTLFTRHISSYTRFSADGLSLDNSYGSRIAPHIESVIEMLQRQPNARQAVLTVNDTGLHLLTESQHHPCTLSIQFLVRQDMLHMQVNMRSNDAIKGVTTDCVVFRLLQLYMANRLSMPAGRYVQTAGSLHVYDSDSELIDSMTEYAQSFELSWSLFDNVTDYDLACFANLLDSNSMRSGTSWQQLKPGLADLYLAAGYRWHRDKSNVKDGALRQYLAARYD